MMKIGWKWKRKNLIYRALENILCKVNVYVKLLCKYHKTRIFRGLKRGLTRKNNV
jgi:hypothetical protein